MLCLILVLCPGHHPAFPAFVAAVVGFWVLQVAAMRRVQVCCRLPEDGYRQWQVHWVVGYKIDQ